MKTSFVRMLALVLACSISAAGLRAQVAYNFQQPDQIVPVSTTTDAGYDILTMDCIAANGYGQWTSSSNSQNANGTPSCFLLGNKLFNLPTPASSGFDDPQAGVLAAKKFTYSPGDGYPTVDAMKAAANLKGNVRYVWINNNSPTGRNSFYVEGFDPGSAGIDISFSSLPTDPSIVKSPMAIGIPVPLASGHQLVSIANEANPLDRFDVAMDASYTYIVWEEATTSHGVLSYSIWAMVVKLDGSIALAPTRVDPLGGSGGRRPTVAVDVRHSGTVAPFDVVYLDPIIPSSSGNVWWTQFISGTSFTPPLPMSTSYIDPLTGPGSSWDAPLHARILDASEATVSPSTTNQRAVYIIAMTNCPSTSNPCFVHLFLDYIKSAAPVTPSEYCDGSSNNARPSGCPVLSVSPLNPSIYYYFQVDDNPLCAFSNPYEGTNSNSSTTDFTEFHCLYQLARGGYDISNPNNPLMIIPGNHVTNGFCVNGNGPGAFYEDPETNPIGFAAYCGAVNQMGVHVHWIGADGTHFYRRDKREFDQNIEENTLLTDTCVIGNTESGVGTATPILLSNLKLTLYSDPNEAVVGPLISASRTFNPPLGWLDFDNGATLNIGSTSPSNTSADFVIAGCDGFSVIGQLPGLADPQACATEPSTNFWTIHFAADNAMDYYGALPDEGSSTALGPQTALFSSQQQFFGTGQITLAGTGEVLDPNGTESGQYVASISDPVTWTIHNTFLNFQPCSVSNNITITATDGIFNFIGNSIGTSFGTYPSSIETFCNASFTNCKFLIASADPTLPSYVYGYGLQINGNGSWHGVDFLPDPCDGTGDANINSTTYPSPNSHLVSLTNCYADLGVDLEGSSISVFSGATVTPPAAVSVSGGLFTQGGIAAAVFDGISPWWPVSITNAYFTKMFGNGVEISLKHYPHLSAICGIPQLYSVTIDNNGFESLSNPADLSGYSTFSSPIFVYGAPDLSGSDALRGAISVTDNVIAPGYPITSGFTFDAGIHFGDVTGAIEGNTFVPTYPDGFCVMTGIWNESSQPESGGSDFSEDLTSTFICSNIIEGCDTGVSTDNWTGYEKLDVIYNDYPSGGGIGHVSSFRDNGHIYLTSINDELGPGYLGIDGSTTDMSGLHHPGDPSDDDPGGDTINSPDHSVAAIELVQPGGSLFSVVKLGQYDPSWSIYGEDNIQGSPDVLSTPSTPLAPIRDVGNNYWNGSFSETGVSFTDNPPGDLTSPPSVTGFTCGTTGLLLSKKKNMKPMSIPPNDTETHCDSLYFAGSEDVDETPQSWQNGYDTVQLFLEQCPFYPNAAQMFVEESEAAQALVGENKLTWDQQLAWLKSVLYLNPDTGWYCEDVGDIIQAVQNDSNEVYSVLQYIYNSGKCPILNGEWTSRDVSVHEHWLDSLERLYGYPGNPAANDSINADTLAHPYVDTTTFPPVTQIGLSILLGPQNEVVGTPVTNTTQALLSAQLLENPVSDGEIDVSYEMGRTALVTMELRDVLGRMVPLTYAKYQLEQPGQHNAVIPVPTLPDGTYYLRIVTDVGDAITLKIVKE